MARMHLVPADRAHRHAIDDHRVCDAIAGIGDEAEVRRLAESFALLGDPTRLMLLLAIDAVPDISVTDLATAVGLNDATVSQALRFLRAAGVVTGRKDGRLVRYRLAENDTVALLRLVRAKREAVNAAHAGGCRPE
jgi:DNA-binding transcriptional ArsR family regulator